MKNLSDFLVKRRNLLCAVMVVAAIACGIAIPFVDVNSDMTKYLPDSSQMKKGLDVMSRDFSDESINTSALRVMFEGLEDDSTKVAVIDELKAFDGITQVSYISDSPDYNNGDYTLYELNSTYESNQQAIAAAIKDSYGEMVTVETGQDGTTPSLSVLLIAGGLLLSVLLLMCESFLEPVIFLFTIGIAVLMNMGTNILLENVSITTHSIAAILQLVLSMDYSIILMNRYRQEKKNCSDNAEAMRRGLKNATSAILSSALTTIVGLLMLVFMNLKLGMDMGIVLAKGVICSLIAIFTILPALIVKFDKAIEASRKKVPVIPTDRISRMSVRFRIPLTVFLFVFFIVAFNLSKLTEIGFSTSSIGGESRISKIFPPKNLIVALYSNEEEDKIISLAEDIQSDEKVDMVVSYPSLILKERAVGDMYNTLTSMSASLGSEEFPQSDILTEDILRLAYNLKHNPEANGIRLSMKQFTSFLNQQMKKSPEFASVAGKDIVEGLTLMDSLVDPAFLNKEMESGELSGIISRLLESEFLKKQNLGDQMSATDLEQMLSVVYMFAEKDSMSVVELLGFVCDDLEAAMQREDTGAPEDVDEPATGNGILTADSGAPVTTEEIIGVDEADTLTVQAAPTDELSMILTYSDSTTIYTQRSISNLSAFFDMKKAQTLIIYKMYGKKSGEKTNTMCVYDFVTYVNHHLVTKKAFASYFEPWQIERLDKIEKIMNGEITLTADSAPLPEQKAAEQKTTEQKTVTEPVPASVQKPADAQIQPQEPEAPAIKLEESILGPLRTLRKFIDIAASGRKLTTAEMTSAFALLSDMAAMGKDYSSISLPYFDEILLKIGYLYYNATSKEYDNSRTMNIEELLDFLIDDVLHNETFAAMIPEEFHASDLETARDALNANLGRMKGAESSLMIVISRYKDESPETHAFVGSIKDKCDKVLEKDHYLIGESVMYYEMKNGFKHEMLVVTLLTLLAIFLIVLITFRSWAVAGILVLTILSGVYINVFVSGIGGKSMLYVAYLIVQSILMGATIDYGILFTTYYREMRRTNDIAESIRLSYKGSILTIMTSGMIMVGAPGVMSLLVTDNAAISMIVGCIAAGAFAAIMLIIFVLPGVLAALDRFVIRGRK